MLIHSMSLAASHALMQRRRPSPSPLRLPRTGMMRARRALLLACLPLVPLTTVAASVEQDIGQAIREAAQNSVNRSLQARDTAHQAYRSAPADALANLDPTSLYRVDDRYRAAWQAPAFGPQLLRLLGSRWLDQQSGLARDSLVRAIAERMLSEGYLFFRLRIAARGAAPGPEIDLEPLPVKLLDNGLQLKIVLRIREGGFFRLDQLRLALFQLNSMGESSYRADVANVDDAIYLSFSRLPRSRLTTVIDLNNFNKQDLFGYNGTLSVLASDLLRLNESLGLSYSNNLAAVPARTFSAYNGFFSVPLLGLDLALDYSQSDDRSVIELGKSSLAAKRDTRRLGLSLKANQIRGDALFHYGLRLTRSASRFDINRQPILAQTYRYNTAELSAGASLRRDGWHASASAVLSRSFRYNRGPDFLTLRTHAEVGDRLFKHWRYRLSLNTQHRLGQAQLPSAERFYPGASTRTRLPFNAAPLSGEHGLNLSSTLSYDISTSGLHRNWVAVGTVSPFVGLDHGRADGRYLNSLTLGVNLAIGQNRLQLYWPKIIGSNVGYQADGGIFLALQAQF